VSEKGRERRNGLAVGGEEKQMGLSYWRERGGGGGSSRAGRFVNAQLTHKIMPINLMINLI